MADSSDSFSLPPVDPGEAEGYKSYLAPQDRVVKLQVVFPDSLKRLSAFSFEYVFWSPAAAYLYGGLNDSIFADFLAGYGREVPFGFYRFQSKLFAGMSRDESDTDWNHVLWFTHREHWDALIMHLCQATVMDAVAKQISKFAHQKLSIPDPLAADRGLFDGTAFVEIFHLAVKASHGVAALDLDTYAKFPLTIPKLRFYDADEHCKLTAAALFSDGNFSNLVK